MEWDEGWIGFGGMWGVMNSWVVSHHPTTLLSSSKHYDAKTPPHYYSLLTSLTPAFIPTTTPHITHHPTPPLTPPHPVSTAMELPRSSARSAMGKKLFGEDLGLADGVVEREDVSDEEAPEMAAALGRARLCTHAQGSMRALAGELLASAPAGKCANCGAHSPQLRKDGYAKLFLMPLAANREAANKVRGTVVHSVLEILRSSAAEATQARVGGGVGVLRAVLCGVGCGGGVWGWQWGWYVSRHIRWQLW